MLEVFPFRPFRQADSSLPWPLSPWLAFTIRHNGIKSFDDCWIDLSFVTGLTLDNQTVVGIATDHYWLGTLGLSPQPTNISNFSNPHPTFLTTLKARNLIPSLSWAYTAGASYSKINPFAILIIRPPDTAVVVRLQNLQYNLSSNVKSSVWPDWQQATAICKRNVCKNRRRARTVSLISPSFAATLAFSSFSADRWISVLKKDTDT